MSMASAMDMMSMPVEPETIKMVLLRLVKVEVLLDSTTKVFFRTTTCITVMWFVEQKILLDHLVEKVN